jgi:hypothetical protein
MKQSSVENVEIYISETLRVYANRRQPSPGDTDVVAICFQYKLEDPRLDAIGFAEDFFRKRNLDAIFVNCCSNEWWQYPDLPSALTILRQFASRWNRAVTYGSSMGGYAALRFAETLGASASIAVGPQYSPRPSVIPGETRYATWIAHTGFLHEDRYRISSHVHNAIIYDPLCREDRPHIERYRWQAPIVPIAIHAGGHTPAILLEQCGLLTECVTELLAGTLDVSRLRVRVRQRRRSSAEYWETLIEGLLERHHAGFATRMARSALAAFPTLELTKSVARLVRTPANPR